ncbi:hypothetical protein GNP80_03570 [Aliivibrio fischeri]|uniref:hypothetical protein n=1 Tax=Aliivibrio fischeri TaxID=668 RepID=UPI0012D9A179|nr:hypothetical protein [Aliivibrio fischeri]MUK91529.1 hypothetical protein [Aliivibrio fischeri]
MKLSNMKIAKYSFSIVFWPVLTWWLISIFINNHVMLMSGAPTVSVNLLLSAVVVFAPVLTAIIVFSIIYYLLTGKEFFESNFKEGHKLNKALIVFMMLGIIFSTGYYQLVKRDLLERGYVYDPQKTELSVFSYSPAFTLKKSQQNE